MDRKELQLEGVGMSMCFFYFHSHCHMIKHSKLVLSFRVSHRDHMVSSYNTPYTDSNMGEVALQWAETMNYNAAPSVFICLVFMGTATRPDLSFK